LRKAAGIPVIHTQHAFEPGYRDRVGVRTLIVGGVVTTICVESTVRDAAMRDYRVYLATDAVGDVDESGTPRASTGCRATSRIRSASRWPARRGRVR
jgi:nicotinamidase-related amidase